MKNMSRITCKIGHGRTIFQLRNTNKKKNLASCVMKYLQNVNEKKCLYKMRTNDAKWKAKLCNLVCS